MYKNKKGISPVVATVLIILITVAAVTVIWAAIIPMVRERLGSSMTCSDAMTQIRLLNEGYTCKASDGRNVSIQIKRLSKPFNLADIQVLVSAGGDTTMFKIKNDTTTIIPIGADVPLPGANEEKVYIINTSSVAGAISMVQIAPIVGVGSSEEICDVSATWALQDC